MINIAVFASGSGTNAQKIMEYFDNHPHIRVSLILSNKSDAQVLLRASNFFIPTFIFDRDTFYNSEKVLIVLKEKNVSWIILAGFMWLVPENILTSFENKIINIHPALLPKFGGKGMYGMKVHEAVVIAKENESGITIHYANAHYDEGNIIFQAKCFIDKNETADSLSEKIHLLEHKYYPTIIEKTILENQ